MKPPMMPVNRNAQVSPEREFIFNHEASQYTDDEAANDIYDKGAERESPLHGFVKYPAREFIASNGAQCTPKATSRIDFIVCEMRRLCWNAGLWLPILKVEYHTCRDIKVYVPATLYFVTSGIDWASLPDFVRPQLAIDNDWPAFPSIIANHR